MKSRPWTEEELTLVKAKAERVANKLETYYAACQSFRGVLDRSFESIRTKLKLEVAAQLVRSPTNEFVTRHRDSKYSKFIFDEKGQMLYVFWKNNVTERMHPISRTEWLHLLQTKTRCSLLAKLRKTKAFPTAKEFFNPVEVHSASCD